MKPTPGSAPLPADPDSRYWEWVTEPGFILGYGRQVPDSLPAAG